MFGIGYQRNVRCGDQPSGLIDSTGILELIIFLEETYARQSYT